MPLLYDSSDLVTHAVIAGMTGSGKTGLGIGLMEEAALDAIPLLVIDPKGDLPNLLLTFPGLSSAEFGPWVHAEDARAAGQSVEASRTPRRSGGQRGSPSGARMARVARLKAVAGFAV